MSTFTTGVGGPTARIPWHRTVSLCMTVAKSYPLDRVLSAGTRLDFMAWLCLHRESSRTMVAHTLPVSLATAGKLFLLNDILGNSLPLVGGPQQRLHHRLRTALRRALFLPAFARDVQGPREAAFMLAAHDGPGDAVNWMAYADWLMDQDDGRGANGAAAAGRERGLNMNDWLKNGQSPLAAT